MSPPIAAAADLLPQYDKPGPRYTSYPTAVEFNESVGQQAYLSKLAEARTLASEPLSLYVHLPFCEHRCSFCGCLVIITQKREVAARYLGYLHREIGMLAEQLGDRRRIVQYGFLGSRIGFRTQFPTKTVKHIRIIEFALPRPDIYSAKYLLQLSISISGQFHLYFHIAKLHDAEVMVLQLECGRKARLGMNR